jgi:hypothetical protein
MADFNVGFVIFPGITQLDFTGPFEVLSRLGAAGSGRRAARAGSWRNVLPAERGAILPFCVVIAS